MLLRASASQVFPALSSSDFHEKAVKFYLQKFIFAIPLDRFRET
jgi:hypothetical protein